MIFAFSLSHRLFIGLFASSFFLLLGLWAWLVSPQLSPMALGPYNNYQCQIVQAHSSATLRVMTPISYLASNLADALCQQSALSEAYGKVEISWPARESLHAEQLVNGHYDLLWNRAEVLEGLVHDYDQLYSEIVKLPRYSVYFVSRAGTPQLTKEYFAQHRLGLLQDQQSYSGYQLAMVAITQAGIQLKPENLRFYPDRAAQMSALVNGDVDVISGVPFDAQANAIAPDHLLLIADQVSSGGWFLNKSLQSPNLRCAVINALHSQDSLLVRMGKPQWQDQDCTL